MLSEDSYSRATRPYSSEGYGEGLVRSMRSLGGEKGGRLDEGEESKQKQRGTLGVRSDAVQTRARTDEQA